MRAVSVAANRAYETQNPDVFSRAKWLVNRSYAGNLAALPKARPTKCFGVFLLAADGANSQRLSKKAEPGKRPGKSKTPERGLDPCDCPPNWYRPAAR